MVKAMGDFFVKKGKKHREFLFKFPSCETGKGYVIINMGTAPITKNSNHSEKSDIPQSAEQT